MNREHIEKLDNPAWADAYRLNLAKAESVTGEGSYDAIAFASVSADLAIMAGEKAETDRAQREAQIIADHNARMAAEAAKPATPAPDPAPRAKAGWAKAIGGINARVPDMPKPAQGEAAQTVAAVLDEQDQRKAKASPGAARNGWAKAAEQINREAGL